MLTRISVLHPAAGALRHVFSRRFASSTAAPSSAPAFDLIVVGGGIVGLACARALQLRHPSLRLCVLEKESALATHQSSRNSGVIHAGIYYKPGSQRAELCQRGAESMIKYCRDNKLPVKMVGKLIVAADESEVPALHTLLERGQSNGVRDLSLVSSSRISELEPNVRGIEGILSPHTGVANFQQVARSYAREVEGRGGVIHTGVEVVRAREVDGGTTQIESSLGQTFCARHVLVCGGLYADRLAHGVFGASPSPPVIPVRGSWLQLRPEHRLFVKRNIYPVPNAAFPFLGVHLTPTLDAAGEVAGILVGPNAALATAREGYDWTKINATDVGEMARLVGVRRLVRDHFSFGAGQLAQELFPHACALKAVQRYTPSLSWEHLQTIRPVPWLLPSWTRPSWRTGVRAQALKDDGTLEEDFVFEVQQQVGRINTMDESAALTAAVMPQHAASSAPPASSRVRLGPAAVLHVRNAPSPAATSSLAIAERVADRAQQAFQL